jgi:hypothetical protein
MARLAGRMIDASSAAIDGGTRVGERRLDGRPESAEMACGWADERL